MEMDTLLVPAERVHRQIVEILAAWGMRPADAAAAAQVMTETDLKGIDSHGLACLPRYAASHRSGALDVTAEERIVRESASTALVDARQGLGHPVSIRAMELAIEKALAHDVGVVSVFNSHHFGAAGHYAEMAAKRGLIGLVACSTRSITMVPTRGTRAVLGTNPIAFAAPAGRHPPVVLDMATTVAAANKVRVYARRGQPLPEGWVLDGQGRVVGDPAEAVKYVLERSEGGLNPVGGSGELGGHKGYGLGLMVHVLGGVLGGASFSPVRNLDPDPAKPDNIGHYFQVLNPAAFRAPQDFHDDLDSVLDTLKAVPPADPALPVLVAGDPERATHAQRSREGIPVLPDLQRQVREIARDANVAYLLG